MLAINRGRRTRRRPEARRPANKKRRGQAPVRTATRAESPSFLFHPRFNLFTATRHHTHTGSRNNGGRAAAFQVLNDD
jgi:hypothetical protein